MFSGDAVVVLGIWIVRVQGTVLETNVGSARVLQKCRYRHEGLLRSFRMVRGIPGNFQLYARLNDD